MPRPNPRRGWPVKRYLPLVVFLSVALAILVMAGFAYLATTEATRIKFEATADDAVGRIESRIDLHLGLLQAARAFFEAVGPAATGAQYRDFFQRLDIEGDLPGLRGIGLLLMVAPGQEAEANATIRATHGAEFGIHPASDLPWRTPVVMFEPLDDSNRAGIGFDMYTDPPRREAIDRAIAEGQPRASGRLMLGQPAGLEPQPGFMIFDEVGGSSTADGPPPYGLLFAAFRADDLFSSVFRRFPPLPVRVEVFDGPPGPDTLLFASEDAAEPRFGEDLKVLRTMNVSGRAWTVAFQPTADFIEPTSRAIPLMLGLAGLFLAAAIALGARYQARAYEVSQALQTTMEKTLVERDLMLQEMKHRIKNSIARVLAIARQTASGSATIQDFSSSFSARLQAMAASQDMLTRSRWQKADLAELLRTELEQVFGQRIQDQRVGGPSVELNEAATQALGLVFHELATNALKYAESGGAGVSVDVSWALGRDGEKRSLALTWKESGQTGVQPPTRTGFGTKLIDMNVTRELGGTIKRDFQPGGLEIEIVVPLGS
jgi:CHASE1-domain containing sensor protein